MSVHLLSVFSVPKSDFTTLNSILSSLRWGEVNGRTRIKWCSWEKICKSVIGGLGVQSFVEVQRSLYTKFTSADSLWAPFFRVNKRLQSAEF